MSDTTWSVKIPEELKEQVAKLLEESGLTGKDFMKQLISLYQLEKAKQRIPEIAEDINELQIIINRINNIYVNMGERFENIIKAKEEEYKQILQTKDEIIHELQQAISTIKKELDTVKAEKENIDNLKKLLVVKEEEISKLKESIKNIEYEKEKALFEKERELTQQFQEKYQILLIELQNKIVGK